MTRTHARVAKALPLLVFLIGLMFSVWAAKRVYSSSQGALAKQFDELAYAVSLQIHQQFDHYVTGLKSARALLLHDPDRMSKREFQTSLAQGQIMELFHGATGVGALRHVPPGQESAFLAWARQQVDPGYVLKPAPSQVPQAVRMPVVWFESGRGGRAVEGLDLAGEPAARQAALLAADEAAPVLSARLSLPGELESQHALLLPVYRPGVMPLAPKARRAALWGWVVAPLLIDRLLADVQQRYSSQLLLSIHERQADGTLLALLATHGVEAAEPGDTLYRPLPVTFGKREWIVTARASQSFSARLSPLPAWLTLGVGVIVSALLAAVASMLARSRARLARTAAEAVDSLRLSEQRHQDMVNRVPAAFYQLALMPDGQSQLRYMSPKIREMFNIQIASFEQFLGLMPATDRERWLAMLADRRDGLVRQFEGRFLYSGSLVGWWQSYSRQTALTDGGCLVDGLLFDITESKETEQSLHAAQQRLELAIETGEIGLWDWLLPEGKVAINPQAGALLGFHPDQSEDAVATWQQRVHPDDLADVNAALQQHLHGQTRLFSRDVRMRSGENGWRWVRYAGRVVERGEDGRAVRMLGTLIDIDQLRKKEQALRESLTMHDLIFRHASVGLAMTRDRRFVRVSAMLASTLGMSVHELEGQPTRILYPDDAAFDLVGSLISEVLPTGQLAEHELSLVRRDGNIFWGRMQGKAIDPSDLSKGVIWIIEDFSERRQREALLEQARLAAEAASRAKSEFLANMSHEIRTPMNAVIGFTSILLDSDLSAEQRDYTQSIRTAGEAMLTLINDLLDFSKIEAGKLELESIEFDIRTAFDETLEIVAEKAASKQLELVCLVQPSVPDRVIGDPGRLRQVLLNLVNNAIKFTEAGEVIIRAQARPSQDGNVVIRVEVHDTGMGIPAGIHPRLFTAFSQADASMTRKFGGTGLGLSICRRLVEAMGGAIGVQSSEGQGSCFWFEVPTQIVAGWVRSALLPDAVRGQRVVAVDDNSASRELLAMQLQRIGLMPSVHASPDALLDELRQGGGQYALAILDLKIAGVDGFSLATQIRALPGLAHLPLVLLTSLTRAGQARQAREAHFSAYLSKPVRESQLLQCINEVLQLRQDDPSLITIHSLAEREAASRPRVLLAEDNPVNQKVAVLILEKLNCRVDVASNGKEAVQALQDFHYDIVFMDCQMPEMDGYDATRAIRSMGVPRADVPVVALTANAFKEDQDLCFAAGMSDFLSKPVTAGGLEAVLKKWLVAPAGPQQAPAATSSPPSGAMVAKLDISPIRRTLDDMAAMLGETIVPEVLSLFGATVDELLPQLQQSVNANDCEGVRRIAHRIKGTLGQIGASDTAALAAQLEQSAIVADKDRLPALSRHLLDQLAQIRTALSEASP